MAEKKKTPQIEVLYSSFSELPDPEGKLQPYTHVVYRDEEGRIGTVTIIKKDPSDVEIAAAVRKQREAEKAAKPKTIRL